MMCIHMKFMMLDLMKNYFFINKPYCNYVVK